MKQQGAKTVARLVLLVIVGLILGGVFVYVRNKPPRPNEIQERIAAGELWGEPRQAADDLFRDEPDPAKLEETDSPSTERWLYEVRSKPGLYYLIRVQDGKISQAQLADQQGRALRPEELSP